MEWRTEIMFLERRVKLLEERVATNAEGIKQAAVNNLTTLDRLSELITALKGGDAQA